MTDAEQSTSDSSSDSSSQSTSEASTDAPVTAGTDPTQTQHPAGEAQAAENQETESPA